MARAYHIGKIAQLFARSRNGTTADPSVQALVEMWDDGVMIVDVHPALNESAEKGRYALISYEFQTPQMSTNTIIKIIDPEAGENTWKRMRTFHERRKKAMVAAQEMDTSDTLPDARMVR
ncbi:MAG: hypothetical protein AABW68_01460 [archaeon]